MRILMIALPLLGLVALTGCPNTSASSASLINDVTLGTACVGEVQAAAPACLAEIPSCVSLGKGVASQVKGTPAK
jgi:hypothetical protein